MRSNSEHKSCPSSTCSEDALLIGKVKQDGTVAFVGSTLQLDSNTVEDFRKLGEPEKYYRFSSPCVQGGCRQWSHGNCGVIKEVLEVLPKNLPPDAPSCVIRNTCRWFYQEGVQACYACSFVITDLTLPVETEESV